MAVPYYFVGQSVGSANNGGPVAGTTGAFTGDVTAKNFVISPIGGYLQWTGAGKITQASDGVYKFANAAGDSSVSLQIGDGTATQATGTLGLTFGTRGNANALNLSKEGAGALLSLQTGTGVRCGMTASAYGLNGSIGSTLGMGLSGTTIVTLNGSGGTYLKWAYASKATTYNVQAVETFTAFDNSGASGQVTFNLPVAVVGMVYSFTAVVAQQIKVQANTSDAISMFGNNKAANGIITGPVAAQGATVTVVCTSANMWSVTNFQGIWT